MNREQLYHKTVDNLYTAYYNGILAYRSSPTCAIGSLIMANMGYVLKTGYICGPITYWKKDGDTIYSYRWPKLMYCGNDVERRIKLLNEYGLEDYELEEKHLAIIGYSIEEIIMIENAFESAYIEDSDTHVDVLTGLNAVLDVLRNIHQMGIGDFMSHSESEDCNLYISNSITDRLVKRHQSIMTYDTYDAIEL